jgi:hypothetical protein
MRLSLDNLSVEIVGLLDTGAAINVLPYQIGLALGAVWEEQTTVVPLTGSLANSEARALLLMVSHPQITPNKPARLVFAWANTDHVPILFG